VGAIWDLVATATVAVTTTGTLAFDLTALWGTANVNNTVTCTNLSIQGLN
jgi:hypothetical protein